MQFESYPWYLHYWGKYYLVVHELFLAEYLVFLLHQVHLEMQFVLLTLAYDCFVELPAELLFLQFEWTVDQQV